MPRDNSSSPFAAQWQARFDFPPEWQPYADSHLSCLKPSKAEELRPLLVFLFEDLPARVARSRSSAYHQVAEAYGWVCFQAWQTSSHFPWFAEKYADFLRVSLKARRLPPAAGVVADLIMCGSEANVCGFQPLVLADPELVREAQDARRAGAYEPFLKAKEKYAEFDKRLVREPAFLCDWKALKKAFPRETSKKGILHRTLVPERNWVRNGGAKFDTRSRQFQAALDLLCWKYCLWGIDQGKPLLLKPSVVVTPFGTQFFIPSYLSFDAKRDLDLGMATRLHRARGQKRQGEKLSASRVQKADEATRAKSYDAEARKLGHKGEARYQFIARKLGQLYHGDSRPIRRLLAS